MLVCVDFEVWQSGPDETVEVGAVGAVGAASRSPLLLKSNAGVVVRLQMVLLAS